MRAIPLATASIPLALLLAGCGSDRAAGTHAALQTFERFQDAVFARDAAALRELVTRESEPVVDAMPWDAVTKRRRLVPTEASDQRSCYHVRVQDPNDPADAGAQAYVVVRENGRLVVDLIATAGLCNRLLQPTGDPADLELRELTPEDHDRVRHIQLDR